jgi:murein DD-endopeptidase MepM/ murein hydrolase activator NlpD
LELQFHPSSRRGAVRTLALGRRGEAAVLIATGCAAVAAVSLWVTVPFVCLRAARAERSVEIAAASAEVQKGWSDLAARARSLRDRALDDGDLISRIAFLYGIPVAPWPRSLNPETGLLASDDPAAVVRGLLRYTGGLDRALVLVAEKEVVTPALAAETPSRLPLSTDLVEPASRFGPRVSPWTGAEEFYPGVDLAAPAGSPVVAPADGVVVFAGRIPPEVNGRLWRFGNLVVLSHGPAGVTLYGHLGKVDVRRGQTLRRGARLGTVGTSGWALFPALHYEFWRSGEDGLAPTDPRFAMLDLRLPGHDVSLEKMLATSAPESLEAPPGVR